MSVFFRPGVAERGIGAYVGKGKRARFSGERYQPGRKKGGVYDPFSAFYGATITFYGSRRGYRETLR